MQKYHITFFLHHTKSTNTPIVFCRLFTAFITWRPSTNSNHWRLFSNVPTFPGHWGRCAAGLHFKQYVSRTATVRQSRSQSSSSSSRPAHTFIMVLTSIENLENLNLGHPRLQDKKKKEEQPEKENNKEVEPLLKVLLLLLFVVPLYLGILQ